MKIAFFEVVEEWAREAILSHEWGDGVESVCDSERLTGANVDAYADAEIMSGFIYSDLSAPILEACPNLKMIATRSTGYDHIDLEVCARRGILVTNVPNYGENTVAEHAFGLILALSRNLHKAYQRTSTFNFSIAGLRGFDLYGRTLGVVGAGNIGLHVIRIGKGFGMRVLAYDTKPQRLISEVLGFHYVDMDTLLTESDVVSLHVPLLPSTRHMINRETIGQMKPGSLLVNTARGGLVDTEALMEALDSGHLGGAGLDVFEGEEYIKEEAELVHSQPSGDVLKAMVQNYRILRRENVVVTPHIGFYSLEAEQRILETTLHSINSFLTGLPPDNAVPSPV